MASLADLPAELYSVLAQLLVERPSSLFSLQRACKALHSVFTQRFIWTATLKAICTRDHLYEPSFPVDSMSVLQIQRAVMAPDLWNAHLKSGKPFAAGAMYTLPRPEIQAQRVNYNRVYFVPGGRYLVEEALSTVSLWDLGLPLNMREGEGNENLAPKLIDTFTLESTSDFPDPTIKELVVHPSQDGERLRIWIASEPSRHVIVDIKRPSAFRCNLQVYEIAPLDPVPQFQKLSMLQLVVSRAMMSGVELSMRHNQAILHTLAFVLVWDFTTDRYALWNIGALTSSSDLVFLSNKSIILLNHRGATVWNLPTDLHPLPDTRMLNFTQTTVPPLAPSMKLEYGSDRSKEPLGRTFSHWYNGLDLPACFDVLEDQATNLVSRYMICPPSDADANAGSATTGAAAAASSSSSSTGPDTSATNPRLLHLLEQFHLPFLDPTIYSLHRISNDMLFTLYRNSKPGFQFGVIFTPFSARDGGRRRVSLPSDPQPSQPPQVQHSHHGHPQEQFRPPHPQGYQLPIPGYQAPNSQGYQPPNSQDYQPPNQQLYQPPQSQDYQPPHPHYDPHHLQNTQPDPHPLLHRPAPHILSALPSLPAPPTPAPCASSSGPLREGTEYGVVGLDLDGDFSGLCSFTFCSVSGRVAYSQVEGFEERGRHLVKVFDFSKQVCM